MIPALIIVCITFAAAIGLISCVGTKAIRQAYQDGYADGLTDIREQHLAARAMMIEDPDGLEFRG